MFEAAFAHAIAFGIRKRAFELWVEDDQLCYYAWRHPCVKVRGYMLLNALEASNLRNASSNGASSDGASC